MTRDVLSAFGCFFAAVIILAIPSLLCVSILREWPEALQGVLFIFLAVDLIVTFSLVYDA